MAARTGETMPAEVADAPGHVPVLLAEAIERLAVRPGGRHVDGTLGLGGHAAAILDRSAPHGTLLGIDADPEARALAATRLAPYGERARITGGNSREIAHICRAHDFFSADGVLLDLGVSSRQFGPEGRGFTIRWDAPLDMRMDPDASLSAATIVNEWEEAALADLIYAYGEERRSRRIAAAIVRVRPLRSTGELAEAVRGAVGRGDGRIHPATRTFQALRIAVNDELAALGEALAGAVQVLRPGGRLVVISYHSGEDRIVKQFLRSGGTRLGPTEEPAGGERVPLLRELGRRVVTPSAAELAENPRSRSAKLRAAERTEAKT